MLHENEESKINVLYSPLLFSSQEKAKLLAHLSLRNISKGVFSVFLHNIRIFEKPYACRTSIMSLVSVQTCIKSQQLSPNVIDRLIYTKYVRYVIVDHAQRFDQNSEVR
jgi:hypothetical protein